MNWWHQWRAAVWGSRSMAAQRMADELRPVHMQAQSSYYTDRYVAACVDEARATWWHDYHVERIR